MVSCLLRPELEGLDLFLPSNLNTQQRSAAWSQVVECVVLAVSSSGYGGGAAEEVYLQQF